MIHVLQIQNPKTASSSLETALTKLHNQKAIKYTHRHGHTLGRNIIRQYNKAQRSNAIILCSVRNPYDRLLSAYQYVRQFKEEQRDHQSLSFYFTIPSFKQFCLSLPHFYERNFFLKPQHEWFLSKKKKMLPTHILRFESLKKDWKHFLLEYNLPIIKLPTIRKTKHHSWKTYYDKEMLKAVGEFYRKDFKLLNYPMLG